MAITGVVNKVMTTAWQDKTLYGFTLEGDDRLFGTGLVKVDTVAKGSAIEFEAKMVKGRWRVEPESIVVKAIVSKPAPEKMFDNKQSKEDYWALKDKVIERQSCRNSAIALTELLLAQGAVPTAKKKEEHYGVILALVEELTDKFVQDNDRIRNPVEIEPEGAPAEVEEEPDVVNW